MTENPIHLNFLALRGPFPAMTIFRKRRQADNEARPFDGARQYTLPIDHSSEERAHYWVSIEERPGFSDFAAEADHNVHLARWVLFRALIAAARKENLEGNESTDFRDQLAIRMHSYAEGFDQLILEPYYLKIAQKFGLIADFHFKLAPGVPFSRAVQQRSLVLTRNYRRNVDFHSDKLARIRSYLTANEQLVQSIRLPGAKEPLLFEDDFFPVEALQLSPRIFTFANGKESMATYAGLRDHGPVERPDGDTKLLFAFRAEDRQAAVRLANALTGKKRYGNYNGFEELFRAKLSVEKATVELKDFSLSEVEKVLLRVQGDDPAPLPVFILPERDRDSYLNIKSKFTNAGLASQVCTASLASSDDDLKWSIANIALQVFCKAGGQPWRVRPTNSDTLIVGISQSHKAREGTGVERFFAFSVLTDSSGLFQKIEVLGDDHSHEAYVDQLRRRLTKQLEEAAERYRTVVIHASFKLRRDDMEAIEACVKAVAEKSGEGKRFAVLKINQDTRFFGLNRSQNSLVPFEASAIRLGGGEFLLWFEGITRQKTTVTKVYPGPTHIQRLWDTLEAGAISEEELLQDLINLSGANWRGFNAKSAPVSVFYCHIVAKLVHDFQERNLPLPEIGDLKPWFL